MDFEVAARTELRVHRPEALVVYQHAWYEFVLLLGKKNTIIIVLHCIVLYCTMLYNTFIIYYSYILWNNTLTHYLSESERCRVLRYSVESKYWA